MKTDLFKETTPGAAGSTSVDLSDKAIETEATKKSGKEDSKVENLEDTAVTEDKGKEKKGEEGGQKLIAGKYKTLEEAAEATRNAEEAYKAKQAELTKVSQELADKKRQSEDLERTVSANAAATQAKQADTFIEQKATDLKKLADEIGWEKASIRIMTEMMKAGISAYDRTRIQTLFERDMEKDAVQMADVAIGEFSELFDKDELKADLNALFTEYPSLKTSKENIELAVGKVVSAKLKKTAKEVKPTDKTKGKKDEVPPATPAGRVDAGTKTKAEEIADEVVAKAKASNPLKF